MTETLKSYSYIHMAENKSRFKTDFVVLVLQQFVSFFSYIFSYIFGEDFFFLSNFHLWSQETTNYTLGRPDETPLKGNNLPFTTKLFTRGDTADVYRQKEERHSPAETDSISERMTGWAG